MTGKELYGSVGAKEPIVFNGKRSTNAPVRRTAVCAMTDRHRSQPHVNLDG